MASVLDPEVKRALAERVRYYNELGIYDFYRRSVPDFATTAVSPVDESLEVPQAAPLPLEALCPAPVAPIAASSPANPAVIPAFEESTIPRRTLVSNQPVPPLVSFGPILPAEQRPDALAAIRDLIGDCQRW